MQMMTLDVKIGTKKADQSELKKCFNNWYWAMRETIAHPRGHFTNSDDYYCLPKPPGTK
jgi:hypothetical protein